MKKWYCARNSFILPTRAKSVCLEMRLICTQREKSNRWFLVFVLFIALTRALTLSTLLVQSSHCYNIICLPTVYNKLNGCLLQYMGEPATCTQFPLVYRACMSCNVWMYSSYTAVARSQPPPVLQVHRNNTTLHVYYMAGIVSIPRLSGFQWQAIDLCCWFSAVLSNYCTLLCLWQWASN